MGQDGRGLDRGHRGVRLRLGLAANRRLFEFEPLGVGTRGSGNILPPRTTCPPRAKPWTGFAFPIRRPMAACRR